MEYARICRWLGLPDGEWPPNHYALLGIPFIEFTNPQLETQVQKRMRQVRGYQLSHPELATEAMNRIAVAFACLSDPEARQRYNAEHNIILAPAPQAEPAGEKSAPGSKSRSATDTDATGLPTVLIWANSAVPPVRPTDSAASQVPASDAAPETPGELPAPAASPSQADQVADSSGETPGQTESGEVKDPILTAAEKSWRIFKGMWSRAILQKRLGVTRALLRSWSQLGRFVAASNQPPPPAQRKPFRGLLERVDRLREDLPALLGEPGQPGYRVAILAQDEDPVQAFEAMGPDERLLLAHDWKIGTALLRSHIRFLETELSEVHREGFLGVWLRPVRTFVHVRAAWVLAFLGLVTVLITLWAVYHR
jgi:hypothetical protein